MVYSPVTFRDVARFAGLVRSKGASFLGSRLFGSAPARVQNRWSEADATASNWWDIPLVVERWNRLVTGNPMVNIRTWIQTTWFPGSQGLSGLSLACGSGDKELAWLMTGLFSHLYACDLSPVRIREAREKALASVRPLPVEFIAGDVRAMQWAPSSFDIIVAEHALHHLAPLQKTLPLLRSWLKPGGYLLVNDFTGPSRFQWTSQQLAEVRRLLALLPEEYRTMRSGKIKKSVHRPGWLSMMLYDPSEAAESSLIVPLLRQTFEIVAQKNYGGAILHLLLKDIAWRFLEPGKKARELLTMLFEAEDDLMARAIVANDFSVLVCRKPAGTAEGLHSRNR